MSEPVPGINSKSHVAIERRRALKVLAASAISPHLLHPLAVADAREKTNVSIATFSADVTPPFGHALFASHIRPAESIGDPLFAKGLVLKSGELNVVLVSVDWLEIRNDAYDRWRTVLAEAAITTRDRVLLTSVHQHDTPLADLAAERILNERGVQGKLIDLDFHEACVQRVAKSLRESLDSKRAVTHFGVGQAKVERVASNRRYLDPDGTPRHGRMSRMPRGYATDQPDGTIDPWLKTLSFWDGDTPLVALSAYATHPMSSYGGGQVSTDFPGLARARRQQETPEVPQIYMSGASGNVVAGKYNDGSRESRDRLVEQLYRAMNTAWQATTRHPIEEMSFRSASLELKPRDEGRYREEALQQQLSANSDAKTQAWAALGMSWHKRIRTGQKLSIPVLNLGKAQFVLLPGESYVEYQLLAQQLRPDSFVMVAGYGECSPGYIPTELAWLEKDNNLDDWCWVAPGAEPAMRNALKAGLLKVPD